MTEGIKMALIAAIPALASVISNWRNKKALSDQVTTLHIQMNSRLDQLLISRVLEAHAAGRREGIEIEQGRIKNHE